MPRPERPLEAGDGPVVRFAEELRTLREKAGHPTYRELARRTHYSVASLSTAADGRKLPTLAVTIAYVRACGGDTVAWERRWHNVAAELATAANTPAIEPTDGNPPPYLGLAAFQPEDADRFFGRERLVEELTAKLSRERWVAVFGASGTGKSSLLRAGLIPRLRTERPSSVVVLFTPGPHPLKECVDKLAGHAAGTPDQSANGSAVDPHPVHRMLRQVLTAHPEEAEVVLVVDQFEEIFTLCRDHEERARFLDELVTAVKAEDSRCRVVLGVRADFYAQCTRHAALVDVLRSALVVGPMTPDELRKAILCPAVRAECTVEAALLATLVAQVNEQAGVLPLLSHALLETWRRRRGNT